MTELGKINLLTAFGISTLLAITSSTPPLLTAQTSGSVTAPGLSEATQTQSSRMKTITNAQRQAVAAQARAERTALRAAAKAAGAKRLQVPVNAGTLQPVLSPNAAVATIQASSTGTRPATAAKVSSAAIVAAVPAGIPGAGANPNSCTPGVLDFFNCGNYANSPLPEWQKDANGVVTGLTPGTGIRKFVNRMAGVGAGNANDLGNFIPVATPLPSPIAGEKADYYKIELKRYTQQVHSDLPPTLFQGYRDASGGDTPHYLGPIIFAQRDRPVRVQFKNSLPAGHAGDPFLPVDTTMKGDGFDATGAQYPNNRALLHLHGGVTPWISDGTPHQWITPDGKKGVSQRNVPDMADPGTGADTWYWTNHQSGRMMWYHDHSYGLTRLNVYAGEVAPYILIDPVEDTLMGQGLLPNQAGLDKSGTGAYKYGIPMVIQDKTFVPPTAATVASKTTNYTMDQLSAEDPTWLGQTNMTPGPVISTADPTYGSIEGQYGQLWFPHVFMPNQNANRTDGVNGYGRWDYGAWVWPPLTGLTHPPISTSDPVTGATITVPPFPNPSAVQESFMDTPLVNGTAYPTMTVGNKAYRFRLLNASNERHWNLQFYYAIDANGNPCKGGANASVCTEVKMVPATPTVDFPSNWPTDGREGGVPDPKLCGPDIIQIGNESGFLPKPTSIPCQPIQYEYNRRVITALNTSYHALLMGPAERADIVVDFSSVPDGAVLILYNDAPAPNPGFDSRLDYYTGDSDQTASGGAPSTLPGYGPNTRTVMQFVVSSGADSNTAGNTFDMAALTAELQSKSYLASQDAPLVPEPDYPTAAGTPASPPNYAYIQNNLYDATNASFQTQGALPAALAADNILTLQPKAIAEEFDQDWGRMTAQLGTELPFTNFLTQTTLQQWYIDPPTEVVNNNETQLWKITHNGVDTHSVHFHLFNVQVINHVAWDGTMYPPDPNELGWKESVRMNPLTDVIVALKPIVPPLPFSLPDSYRLLDPTMPAGTTSAAFTNVDPQTNNPISVSNQLTNFGWEYVWHCHLLGHEENDMMRPMIIQVPPETPTNFTATMNTNKSVTLTWNNTAASASGFVIQRSTDPNFATNVTNIVVQAPAVTSTSQIAVGTPGSYTDSSVNPTVTNYYQVAATKLFNNQVLNSGPLSSPWSTTKAVSAVPTPVAILSPGNLLFPVQVMKTASAPQTLTLSNTGTAALTITSGPVISGSAAGDYKLTNSCSSTVAVGASCIISVTFTPLAASVPNGRVAAISLGTNDPLHPALNTTLSGTGTALSVSPVALPFGSVRVGQSSTLSIALATASGAAIPLTGTGILLNQAAGDYTQTNNCTNNRIPVAGCTIKVKFAPVATGTKPATVTISTADAAGRQMVTVTGTGVASQLAVSPSALSFSASRKTTSAAQTVTVSNTGTAPLTINGITAPGTSFGVTGGGATGACAVAGLTLAPNTSCTVAVVFTPSATASGIVTGTLNVNIPAASGTSALIPLTGTVLTPTAGLSASVGGITTPITSATSLSLANKSAVTFTVTSTGTGPLFITGSSLSGTAAVRAQFVITDNCSTQTAGVPPGGSCTISVAYTKSTAKTPPATSTNLSIAGSSVTIPLVTLNGQ